MGKLISLKLDGDFNQGFRVTLEIGSESDTDNAAYAVHPETEIKGWLPPATELTQQYYGWQSTYRSLGKSSRIIKPKAIKIDGSLQKNQQECHNRANELCDRFNTWLRADSFFSIREKWLEKVRTSEEVRIIISAENHQLWQLPWQQWDFLERYSKAEIGLSTLEYERPPGVLAPPCQDRVRILAILGNSYKINVEQDRHLLEKLPNAEVTFLVEPQRQELNDQLWEQNWDILFFAGHSNTEGERGRIYINQKDSLTLDQLKHALKQAVASGLQLAIFNSCDGLGLARELEKLHIPQMIVMREPVADLVAHAFLKYFLQAFSTSKHLYWAVQEARKRLQGLEDKFPCASWLPVICQNPAAIPLRWPQLPASPKVTPSPEDQPESRQSQLDQKGRRWQNLLVGSILITGLVMGIRLLGGLQPAELWAFDQLMRLRPDPGLDSRLLVVKVTEQDIQKQSQYPLSDRTMEQLLKKLQQHQPRVIGLDIYRDLPVAPGHADLAAHLQRNQRLVTICFAGKPEANNPDQVGVPPPPDSPQENRSFSDIAVDPDGVVRRHLFYLIPDPKSACQVRYAFSAELASRYLETEGIKTSATSEGYLKFGKTVLRPLEKHTGFYHYLDDRGHQVLLNYRSSSKVAQEVTLTEVLNNDFNPDLVRNRIVLIGVTAPSVKDYFATPYGTTLENKMSGVFVHAQMVSHMVDVAKQERALLGFLPQWVDALWIGSWSVAGGLIVWCFRASLNQRLAVGVAIVILYSFCFGFLLVGICLPLVPSVLALVVTWGLKDHLLNY
ncbi:CHASE2 domain-containing protein [Lyngbya aestuarii]|uniref:CHASE2 domain-containing protein n=1 Tax=Lyngbya aestuarii TaxID=118322 RepID=UPI00403E1FED